MKLTPKITPNST